MSISVSWNLFATTVGSLLAAYYAIVILIFYRAEISYWLKTRSTGRSGDSKLPDIGHGPSVMGTAKDGHFPVTVERVSAQDLMIAPHEPESEIKQATGIKDEIVIGSVADLLQEAKILIQSIAEDRMGKSESKELFSALFIRYPHLQNTTYPQAISLYICEAAKDKMQWEVTLQEMLTWWNNGNI